MKGQGHKIRNYRRNMLVNLANTSEQFKDDGIGPWLKAEADKTKIHQPDKISQKIS